MREIESLSDNPDTQRIKRRNKLKKVGRGAFKTVSAASLGTLAFLAPEGSEHTTTPHGIVWEAEPVFGNRGVVIETSLGDGILPAFRGPFGLNVRISDIPVERTLESFQNGDSSESLVESFEEDLESIKNNVLEDLKKDLMILALGGSIGWIVGDAIVRKEKPTRKDFGKILAKSVLAGALLTGSVTGVAAATYDEKSSEKITFTGGIAYAQDQLGLLEKFEQHDELIAHTVNNYLKLSKFLQGVNTEGKEPEVCLMVVSDIHSRDVAPLLKAIIETSCVDAILDAGDITEWGSSLENASFSELGKLGVNYYVVQGNHDSGDTMAALRAVPNVTVLAEQEVNVKGITITGVGDSDYSPDDSISGQGDRPQLDQQTGLMLKKAVDQHKPDIAIVHKPSAAKEVTKNVRMAIAGHTHTCEPQLAQLESGTLFYKVGTTGGSHLRTFDNKCKTSENDLSGQPQTFSIVYFDKDNKPYAVDEFTLSGLQPDGKLNLHVARIPITCTGQCEKPGQQEAEKSAGTSTTVTTAAD
ncbi:MAG TPA: metallophosphoesterase [Xanthomonadales bacterium]|nr:metallophosphoesterase [Xanthomonadales bacterium]